MKMNRIVCSILTLLLVFSLASCAGEPIFLIVMSENTSDKLKGEFEAAEQYGVYCSASREVLDDFDQKILKDPISNQDLEYAYSECSYKNNLTKEYGTHYSIYDIYKSEDAKIAVLHNTDLVCFYSKRNRNNDGVVYLTDGEAKSRADAFLVSMLGTDIHSAFNIVSVKPDTTGLFSHVIHYTRLTNGHKTDENIAVYIGKSGDVVGYNGYNVGKYDALKDKFNDRKINSAIDSLINKIDSLGLKNIKKNEPIITTDTDGSLFIRIDFSYEDDYGFVCGETVLVNVG